MNVAIIAAAGQGTRMAGKRPKQFLELAGTPILIHTLKAFEQCDAMARLRQRRSRSATGPAGTDADGGDAEQMPSLV